MEIRYRITREYHLVRGITMVNILRPGGGGLRVGDNDKPRG